MTFTRSLAALAVAMTLSPACADDAGSAVSSVEARVWFERALELDVGAGGAPDASQAFAAMRRAAEAGDPQAAFNVAVMLDSGRGVARNMPEAAVWYARAAARGMRRGAFNLGLLYESGDGVPTNVDLSRAWYVASNLPAAREHLAKLTSATDRPVQLQAPKAVFPVEKSSLSIDDGQVDLVWTSCLEPEPVRFFVELRSIDARASRETWSGFVDTSSVRLPLPASVRTLAWRVSAVATGSAEYAVSGWSIFTVPQAAAPLGAPGSPSSETSDGGAHPRRAEDRNSVVSGVLRERPLATTGDPASETSGNAAAVHKMAPAEPAVVNASRSDRSDEGTLRSRHEDKDEDASSVSREAVLKADRSKIPAARADLASVSRPVAQSVLIILAQPDVTNLFDLNNKAVVIAGLTSISLATVDTALSAAGAGAVQLTQGTKSDIDKLLDGKVSAAIIACVTPERAQSFPEIAGFRLLRVAVNDLSRNIEPRNAVAPAH